MKETLNDSETTQPVKDSVNDSVDFWVDAQEFLKSQLPSDFEDKLKEYTASKGYNQNDFRLFKHMLVVGFHGTIVF